jgi:hypothetical protein
MSTGQNKTSAYTSAGKEEMKNDIWHKTNDIQDKIIGDIGAIRYGQEEFERKTIAKLDGQLKGVEDCVRTACAKTSRGVTSELHVTRQFIQAIRHDLEATRPDAAGDSGGPKEARRRRALRPLRGPPACSGILGANEEKDPAKRRVTPRVI